MPNYINIRTYLILKCFNNSCELLCQYVHFTFNMILTWPIFTFTHTYVHCTCHYYRTATSTFMKMKHLFTIFACYAFWYAKFVNTDRYCHEILQDKNVKKISWPYLKQCLTIVNGEDIPKEFGENIWRLMKIVSISFFILSLRILSYPAIRYKGFWFSG